MTWCQRGPRLVGGVRTPHPTGWSLGGGRPKPTKVWFLGTPKDFVWGEYPQKTKCWFLGPPSPLFHLCPTKISSVPPFSSPTVVTRKAVGWVEGLGSTLPHPPSHWTKKNFGLKISGARVTGRGGGLDPLLPTRMGDQPPPQPTRFQGFPYISGFESGLQNQSC